MYCEVIDAGFRTSQGIRKRHSDIATTRSGSDKSGNRILISRKRFVWSMTVFENLEFPLRRHSGRIIGEDPDEPIKIALVRLNLFLND